VQILDKDPAKNRNLVITLPARTTHVVAELKRQIFAATKIKPIDQRLQLSGGVDSFSIPASVRMVVREPRALSHSLVIRSFKETSSDEIFSLKVDPSDTILDLKFLLEPHVKIAAEFIRLYFKYPNAAQRTPLADDSATVASARLPQGAVLKMLFELPSFDAGHGPVHRAAVNLTRYADPKIQDVGSCFRDVVKRYPKRNFLGTRSYSADGKTRGAYQWQTYEQVGRRVDNFAAGLRALGLGKGDCVGIMSNNRSEWLITDYACCVQSLISVPLYDTLGPDAVEYIVNHASVKVAVVNVNQLKALLAVKERCKTLSAIIAMDDAAHEKSALAAVSDPLVRAFSAVESAGAARVRDFPDVMPSTDDVYTICYTSGTTGNPKGLKLNLAVTAALIVCVCALLCELCEKVP
jgi:hypothetical protein